MSEKYLLECCVDSVESALEAEKGGADRLELCANLVIGGTTPSLSLYEQIRKHSHIRIHALIRPRFGDFLYTDEEFEILKKEVVKFRQAGAEGIVIGCLTPDGELDLEKMKQLMECADGMSVTLHRAFDMCKDQLKTLELAKTLGVNTILTSGGAPSCLEGISRMKELAEAAGNSISILAGAGINADAVRTLLKETSLTHFHMSGKKVLESGMKYRNPAVSMGIPGMSEYHIWRTDSQAVRAVRTLLDECEC